MSNHFRLCKLIQSRHFGIKHAACRSLTRRKSSYSFSGVVLASDGPIANKYNLDELGTGEKFQETLKNKPNKLYYQKNLLKNCRTIAPNFIVIHKKSYSSNHAGVSPINEMNILKTGKISENTSSMNLNESGITIKENDNKLNNNNQTTDDEDNIEMESQNAISLGRTNINEEKPVIKIAKDDSQRDAISQKNKNVKEDDTHGKVGKHKGYFLNGKTNLYKIMNIRERVDQISQTLSRKQKWLSILDDVEYQKKIKEELLNDTQFIKNLPSIFRRELDTELCIAVNSQHGISLLKSAINGEYGNIYHTLAPHHLTQFDSLFCGPSSLVMVLNALHVDPGKQWKYPWRWFDEEMLCSCKPQQHTTKNGCSLDALLCTAKCNQLSVKAVRATSQWTIDQFRNDVKRCCHSFDTPMISNFSRKQLNQSGTGHFSPIGAYAEDEDMVLVMETARFKYPPFWVSLELLWKSMQKIAVNGKGVSSGHSRGYLIIEKPSQNVKQSIIVQASKEVKIKLDYVNEENLDQYYAIKKSNKLWNEWLDCDVNSSHKNNNVKYKDDDVSNTHDDMKSKCEWEDIDVKVNGTMKSDAFKMKIIEATFKTLVNISSSIKCLEYNSIDQKADEASLKTFALLINSVVQNTNTYKGLLKMIQSLSETDFRQLESLVVEFLKVLSLEKEIYNLKKYVDEEVKKTGNNSQVVHIHSTKSGESTQTGQEFDHDKNEVILNNYATYSTDEIVHSNNDISMLNENSHQLKQDKLCEENIKHGRVDNLARIISAFIIFWPYSMPIYESNPTEATKRKDIMNYVFQEDLNCFPETVQTSVKQQLHFVEKIIHHIGHEHLYARVPAHIQT